MNIEFQNIHVTLGRQEILKGIDLSAENGQITGIVGPNGCGKSTLIKSFFDIVPKSEGVILLDKADIAAMSRKEIAAAVGYVGQDIPCVFNFSVRDVVEMALYSQHGKTKGKAKDIIDQALEELQITHLEKRSILELSGGERKMVFIARSIAQGVDTIFLDEPTNHLDIKHQLFIMNYLKNSGKTVVIVLHDLSLATHFCDQIYLLKQGQNVAQGTPAEVLCKLNIASAFEVRGQVIEKASGSPEFVLDMDTFF